MTLPNLASRPFLNTRPPMLLTIVAALLALIFLVLNVHRAVVSRGDLAEQYAQSEQLENECVKLRAEAREHLAALEEVPWGQLDGRVERINVILSEHAFSWLRLLDDVERVLPYQVRLTRIAPTIEEDKVELGLSVVAQSREAMLDFLDRLIADPAFSDPFPIAETLPDGDNSLVAYAYTMRVNYHPAEVGS